MTTVLPPNDTHIITLLIVGVPTLITSIASLIASLRNTSRINDVRFRINGRMDQLLAITRINYHTLGVQEERKRQSASNEKEP